MVTWWAQIERLKHELAESRHAAEIVGLNLRTAERDLERLSNEYNLLQADFKALVAQTAGRLQPRVAPLDLERDPFREIPTIPTEWLTDDSELPDIAAEELLDSGATSEAGRLSPGAEASS